MDYAALVHPKLTAIQRVWRRCYRSPPVRRSAAAGCRPSPHAHGAPAALMFLRYGYCHRSQRAWCPADGERLGELGIDGINTCFVNKASHEAGLKVAPPPASAANRCARRVRATTPGPRSALILSLSSRASIASVQSLNGISGRIRKSPYCACHGRAVACPTVGRCEPKPTHQRDRRGPLPRARAARRAARRQLATALGISLGKANYCIQSLL